MAGSKAGMSGLSALTMTCSDWRELPPDVLRLVFQQLNEQLLGLTVRHVAELVRGPLLVNMHWRAAAISQLKLHLICSGEEREVQLLRGLAATFPLVSLCFYYGDSSQDRQAGAMASEATPSDVVIPGAAPDAAARLQRVFEFLADERFQQQVAGTLRHLRGAPWRRSMRKQGARKVATNFQLAAYPQLRKLQLSWLNRATIMLDQAFWQDQSCLEGLVVEVGPSYGAVQVESLPPQLKRLTILGHTSYLAIHLPTLLRSGAAIHHTSASCGGSSTLHLLTPVEVQGRVYGGREALKQHVQALAEAAAAAVSAEEEVELALWRGGCRAVFDKLCFADLAGRYHSIVAEKHEAGEGCGCCFGGVQVSITFERDSNEGITEGAGTYLVGRVVLGKNLDEPSYSTLNTDS